MDVTDKAVQERHMFGFLKRLVRLVTAFDSQAEPVRLGLHDSATPTSRTSRRRPFDPPRDPDVSVSVPKWRRPSDRSSAAAVNEPDESESLSAIGSDSLGKRSLY